MEQVRGQQMSNSLLEKTSSIISRCLFPERHIEKVFDEAIERVREENRKTEEGFSSERNRRNGH